VEAVSWRFSTSGSPSGVERDQADLAGPLDELRRDGPALEDMAHMLASPDEDDPV
jgi:hypothetical protein